MVGCGKNPLDVMPNLLRHLLAVRLTQEPRETVYVTHWRTEIVRDGIAEGFEFLVRGNELVVGLCERLPVRFKRFFGETPIRDITNRAGH